MGRVGRCHTPLFPSSSSCDSNNLHAKIDSIYTKQGGPCGGSPVQLRAGLEVISSTLRVDKGPRRPQRPVGGQVEFK